MFGFNFAPKGWALCNGQLLPINQNQALFALLGTQYGGDGRTTFGLPNLQSRVAVHQGTGPGLSQYTMGEQLGVEAVTLTGNQLPSHAHAVEASNAKAKVKDPAGAVLGHTKADIYSAASDDTTMNLGMIAPTGGSQPHENRQPLLVVNFCIALQGIFPSRS
jgi:microcystin-dependent protein